MADYIESIPYFDNGDSITGWASAAIEGGRFLMITGATTNGLATVAHNDGTKPAIGVSAHSADIGFPVGIHRAKEILAPVTCSAALTAGTAIKSDATGQAAPGTVGTDLIQGTAFDDAASGSMAPIDREGSVWAK
jgi:hypothetical protein